jgi:hypothetical protein
MITVPKRRGVIAPQVAEGLTYAYQFPFLFDRVVELHTKRDPTQDPPPPAEPPPITPIICTPFWDSSVLTDSRGNPLGIPGFLYYVGNALWINPTQCCPPNILNPDGSEIDWGAITGPVVSGSAAYIPGQNAASVTITFTGTLDYVQKWPRTCPSQRNLYAPEIWGGIVTCTIDEMSLPEHEAHQGCGTTIMPVGSKPGDGSVLIEFACG